eukprot:362426-Chlamydomonas_euryale.AAC.2
MAAPSVPPVRRHKGEPQLLGSGAPTAAAASCSRRRSSGARLASAAWQPAPLLGVCLLAAFACQSASGARGGGRQRLWDQPLTRVVGHWEPQRSQWHGTNFQGLDVVAGASSLLCSCSATADNSIKGTLYNKSDLASCVRTAHTSGSIEWPCEDSVYIRQHRVALRGQRLHQAGQSGRARAAGAYAAAEKSVEGCRPCMG